MEMAKLIVLPKLGLTMTEGTIARWYKQEGDEVKVGDILYDLETDKLTNEIEARNEGILRKIFIQEGEKAPCLAPVAIIAAADEDIADLMPGGAEPARKEEPKAEEVPAAEAPPAEAPKANAPASPAAKKLAREKGIDIALVTGTGPGGRITIEDVEKYTPAQEAPPLKASPVAEKLAADKGIDLKDVPAEGRIMKADVEKVIPKAEAGGEERVKMSGMRKVIAKRMAESWNTCPTVTFDISVDITNMDHLRDLLKKEEIPVSYTDIIAFMTARTLHEFPLVNSSVDGTDIILKKYVNLGIAVALDDGLLVPVIRDADKKGLKELSTELKLLATDARAGRLGPDSLSGGTFTITNLGMFGIESFSPIINLPEVAILGVNAIREVVVPDCCGFTTKKYMGLSLTADHRVVDGSVAAQFLARLRKKLENPALLFI